MILCLNSVRILVCVFFNVVLDEVVVCFVNCMLDKFGDFYSFVDGVIVCFGLKRVIYFFVYLIFFDILCVWILLSFYCFKFWVDFLDGVSVVCVILSGCGNIIFDELENKFDVIIVGKLS